DPLGSQCGLDLGDAQRAEVEDAGGQQRIGSGGHGRSEVLDFPGPARGDERQVYGGAGGGDEFEVEALARAVGIDGVQQDLADSALGGLPDPVDRAAARASRPPRVVTSKPESVVVDRARRASRDRTRTWLPKWREISLISPGFAT